MKVCNALLVAVVITVLGCDVKDNDILTGLNRDCNYDGVCMQFTAGISKCVYPTANPTSFPTSYPSHSPMPVPTDNPTPVPTGKHNVLPANFSTDIPTGNPTRSPTDKLSGTPRKSEPAVPFYRYFHSGIVDHFYTTNWNELGGGRHGWRYEGIQCKLYRRQVRGTIPLYRYWGNNDHFYTTNINEIGTGTPGKVGKHGFKSEGIAGYCYPGRGYDVVPLHRFYHHGMSNHFYTTSYSEGSRASYTYEGVACYVVKK